MSVGRIIGLVFAVAGGLVFIVVIVLYCVFWKKKEKDVEHPCKTVEPSSLGNNICFLITVQR